MNVGDYVRTDNGEITKIKDIWENERIFFENIINLGYIKSDSIYASQKEKCIIKSSPNIIDLIEVGDYVNGHRVSDIYEDIDGQIRMKFGENSLVLAHKSNYDNYYLFEEDIKSIVTHEQFSQMEYKVGE